MKLRLPLLILVFVILTMIFVFPSNPPSAEAYVCGATATLHHRGCGYNPCTADSRYNTHCYCTPTESCCADCTCPLECGQCGYNCCSPSNGNWSACNATGVVQTCGGASCGGSQNCSPVGGTIACCLVAASCSISTTYTPTVAISGCANGELTISAGTTTINNGYTFDFGTLIVTSGIIVVPGTGVIKTSASCI